MNLLRRTQLSSAQLSSNISNRSTAMSTHTNTLTETAICPIQMLNDHICLIIIITRPYEILDAVVCRCRRRRHDHRNKFIVIAISFS